MDVVALCLLFFLFAFFFYFILQRVKEVGKEHSFTLYLPLFRFIIMKLYLHATALQVIVFISMLCLVMVPQFVTNTHSGDLQQPKKQMVLVASPRTSITTNQLHAADDEPMLSGSFYDLALASRYAWAPEWTSVFYKRNCRWIYRLWSTPFHLWYAIRETDAAKAEEMQKGEEAASWWPDETEDDDAKTDAELFRQYAMAPRDASWDLVVYPLHALYLQFISAVVNQWEGNTKATVSEPEKARFLFTPGWLITVLVVTIGGVPVLWRTMMDIAQLVVAARRDRHVAARMRQLWLVGLSSGPTGGEVLPKNLQEEVLPQLQGKNMEKQVYRMAFVGSLLFHLVAFLPSLVLEMSTLYPVCYGTLLLLQIISNLLQDERLSHPKDPLTVSSLQHPVELPASGGSASERICFSTPPTRLGAHVLSVYAVGMGMCTLFIAPAYALVFAPLFVWMALTCLQKAYRPLAVYRRDTEKKSSSTVAGRSKVFKDLILVHRTSVLDGPSFSRMLCYILSPILIMALMCIASISFGTGQPVMTTVNLFAGGGEQEEQYAPILSNVSLTGAWEVGNDACLYTVPSNETMGICALSAPNLWLVAEYVGLPLTSVFNKLGRQLGDPKTASDPTLPLTPRAMRMRLSLFQFLAKASLVFSIILSLCSVAAYRFSVADPWKLLESAVAQFRRKREHVERTRETWLASKKGKSSTTQRDANVKALETAGSKSTPPSTATPSPTNAASSIGVGIVSREEFLLKQLLLLLHWLSTAALCGLLLLTKPRVTSLFVLFPLGGLLLATYAIMSIQDRFWAKQAASLPAPTPAAAAAGGGDPWYTAMRGEIEQLVSDHIPESSQWCARVRLHDHTDLLWQLLGLIGLCLGVESMLGYPESFASINDPHTFYGFARLLFTVLVCAAGVWWALEWVRHRSWARSALSTYLVLLPLQLTLVVCTLKLFSFRVDFDGYDSAGDQKLWLVVLKQVGTVIREEFMRAVHLMYTQLWAVASPERWVRDHLASATHTGGPMSALGMQNCIVAVVLLLGTAIHYTYRIVTLALETEDMILM